MRERIRADGPISVEAYMDACNTYYYATRDPLGTDGDFITAPEISQMFGELIGVALADSWANAGEPADAVYAELGPGRGTLAADALRVMHGAGFAGAVHFVETSPVLRAQQAERVPDAIWRGSIEDLPPVPLLLVANEFFDALPVQQWVDGVERRVTIAAGGLAFDRDGAITEISPVCSDAVKALAERLARDGGVALIVDYGHARSMPGDTLQAVKRHRFAHVLEKPGEQDLTAHVDFEALARVALDAGARTTNVVPQGVWLERLGIAARTEALGTVHPQRTTEFDAARTRLCHPDAMGELFKVMAIHSSDWPSPAGFQ